MSDMTCECDMTHSYAWHDVHMWHDWFLCVTRYMNVTWLIPMLDMMCKCDMTHSYKWRDIHMWHDWFLCVTRCINVTWLIPIGDIIYTWHDFFTCGIMHTCDMTHSYAWRVIHMTWLFHVRHYVYMCHDSFLYMPCYIHVPNDSPCICITYIVWHFGAKRPKKLEFIKTRNKPLFLHSLLCTLPETMSFWWSAEWVLFDFTKDGALFFERERSVLANLPCHVWMSHVTYGWVMSHVNESCHKWISHVTYGSGKGGRSE